MTKPKKKGRDAQRECEQEQESCQRLSERLTAFVKRVDQAFVEGNEAMHAAKARGEPQHLAIARGNFVRDALLTEAVNLLPRQFLTRADFDAMPVFDLQLWSKGRPLPTGEHRMQLFLGWIIGSVNEDGTGMLYLPDFPDGTLSSDHN
jgi:hypothetical protein